MAGWLGATHGRGSGVDRHAAAMVSAVAIVEKMFDDRIVTGFEPKIGARC